MFSVIAILCGGACDCSGVADEAIVRGDFVRNAQRDAFVTTGIGNLPGHLLDSRT